MSTELKPSYLLSDLLVEAGKMFKSSELRALSIFFYPGLVYTVEYTDARTNRLRYLHVEQGQRTVLAYQTLDNVNEFLRDFEHDIKERISSEPAEGAASTEMKAQVFLSGQLSPVEYKARPGGRAYVRIGDVAPTA